MPMRSPPLAATLLALSTLLVSLLTLLSFAFTITALTSADWAEQVQWSVDDTDPDQPYFHSATEYRGPTRECIYQIDLSNPDAPWTWSCVPGGCQGGDQVWWCQQETIGRNLLIAGCVFAGLACVYAFVGLVALLPPPPPAEDERGVGDGDTSRLEGDAPVEAERRRVPHRRRGWRHHVTRWRQGADHSHCLIFITARSIMYLFLVLSIILFAGGSLVLEPLLVDDSPFDGSFISNITPSNLSEHWTAGKGALYGSLAWFFNILALIFVPSVDMVFYAQPWHEQPRHHVVVEKGVRERTE